MDIPSTIQVCSAYRLMFVNESSRLDKISKILCVISSLISAFTATVVFSDAATSGHTVLQYVVGSCSFIGAGLGAIPEILKISTKISEYSNGYMDATKLIQDLREIDEETSIPSELKNRFNDLESRVFCLPERCYHAAESFLSRYGMTELGLETS